MTADVITLGQVADSPTVLRVTGNRCSCACQLQTDRVVAEPRRVFPLPRLREVIAADCSRMQASELRDPCGVHFPQLQGLFS